MIQAIGANIYPSSASERNTEDLRKIQLTAAVKSYISDKHSATIKAVLPPSNVQLPIASKRDFSGIIPLTSISSSSSLRTGHTIVDREQVLMNTLIGNATNTNLEESFACKHMKIEQLTATREEVTTTNKRLPERLGMNDLTERIAEVYQIP